MRKQIPQIERSVCAFSPLRIAWKSVLFAFLLGHYFSTGSAIAEGPEGEPQRIVWKNIEAGFDFARYELGEETIVIHPEVYLLRFQPTFFTFHAVQAEPVSEDDAHPAADIRTLTKKIGGVAGINANFFDEKNAPLGLIIEKSVQKQKLHRGGHVITGIFQIRNNLPGIIHRDSFLPESVTTAIQAGPRLIGGGEVLQISSADDSSRRSGIAITKKNEVILYATVLRFPGATLRDIQHMLSDPQLNIADALNLDGGGSSQIFIENYPSLKGETSISGGDFVPVGFVVKRKGEHE